MLEIDWVTILFEVVNFVIITVVLYFLVFKPIVKRSEARAVEKARLMDEMVRDQESAALHLAEIESRLKSLDVEIEKITDEAYENNKALQADLLAATHKEAEKILQNALMEVRKEQFVEMKKHQSRLVDVVLSISAGALQKITPLSVHANLIEELTRTIWDLGKTDMRQVQSIRESLSERTPKAYVTTAHPLTAEQELNLVRTFSALADNDVQIELETDENLIAGLKVRLGDQIIENTMAAQLEGIRDEISQTLEQVDIDYDG